MGSHHALLLAVGALGLLFAACNDVPSDGPSGSGGKSSGSASGDEPTTFSVFPVGGGAGGEGASDQFKLPHADWAMGGNPLRTCEESVSRSCYGAYVCAGSQTCVNNAWTACVCDVNAGGATSTGGATSSAGAAGSTH